MLKTREVKFLLICVFAVLILEVFSSKEEVSSGNKLKLVIIADQFPYQHINKYRKDFTGGLKFIADNSTFYTNVNLSYVNTNTCPGHATIVTGSPPRVHGVINNWWFDKFKNKVNYCVADEVDRISPRQLKATTFTDIHRRKYPKSKIFSVSGKDRAATMLAGKRANAAFWYNKRKGKIESSSYYLNKLPNYINNINKNIGSYFFGKTWSGENFKRTLDKVTFSPTKRYYENLYESPFVDTLTNKVAIEILKNEIYNNPGSHVLNISYSALDTVGHTYGPDSVEVRETLFNLDKLLSKLLFEIDSAVGLKNTEIIFTSDHGVQRFPEISKKGIRLNGDNYSCIQNIGIKLNKKFGSVFQKGLYLKGKYKDKHKEIYKFLESSLSKCGSIKKIINSKLLSEKSTEPDKSYFNSYFKNRSPDFYFLLKENYLPKELGTGHGTIYPYDTHVPLFHFKNSGKNTDSKKYYMSDLTRKLLFK